MLNVCYGYLQYKINLLYFAVGGILAETIPFYLHIKHINRKSIYPLKLDFMGNVTLDRTYFLYGLRRGRGIPVYAVF